MRREDILYEQEFGSIPNEQLDRVAFILGKKSNNEKFNKEIERIGKKIKRIKSNKISFTMWTVVKPSARPRATTRRGYISMYVPGAREREDWFEHFAVENNLPHINTPCKLYIDHYEKTPTSMSIKNKVLSELGLIRPTKRTGDFDNYAKSISDMLQTNGLFLQDDCLIYESRVRLFYSIKPHTDVTLEWLNKDPRDIK